jgi:hypothetical protein
VVKSADTAVSYVRCAYCIGREIRPNPGSTPPTRRDAIPQTSPGIWKREGEKTCHRPSLPKPLYRPIRIIEKIAALMTQLCDSESFPAYRNFDVIYRRCLRCRGSPQFRDFPALKRLELWLSSSCTICHCNDQKLQIVTHGKIPNWIKFKEHVGLQMSD